MEFTREQVARRLAIAAQAMDALNEMGTNAEREAYALGRGRINKAGREAVANASAHHQAVLLAFYVAKNEHTRWLTMLNAMDAEASN